MSSSLLSSSESGILFMVRICSPGGGRVVRRCWVNLQCRGVLPIWITVGQGPIALAVGAGGGLFKKKFSRISFLFSISLSREILPQRTVKPKSTSQPTCPL